MTTLRPARGMLKLPRFDASRGSPRRRSSFVPCSPRMSPLQPILRLRLRALRGQRHLSRRLGPGYTRRAGNRRRDWLRPGGRSASAAICFPADLGPGVSGGHNRARNSHAGHQLRSVARPGWAWTAAVALQLVHIVADVGFVASRSFAVDNFVGLVLVVSMLGYLSQPRVRAYFSRSDGSLTR
jgi:hypothetical protein